MSYDLALLRAEIHRGNAITAALLRAGLPQFYTVEDLMHRWKMTRDMVIYLLRAANAYELKPGVEIRIHLDDVLAIDEQLRATREGGEK